MLYTSLPAAPFLGLRREIDRLFLDAVEGNGTLRADWSPAADIREDEKGVTIDLELAGVDPQKVDVTADKGVLTVAGTKSIERAMHKNDARWHMTERMDGAFKRAFRLPEALDASAIEATFTNGVLTIRVPRAALPQPTKIQVKTN